MQCPICKCNLVYKKEDFSNSKLQCKNNHSFDVSKYGYVNLLISKTNSGDNKEMVSNRHKFLKKDYYLELALAIKEIIKKLNVNRIVDIGCGEGYFDRKIIFQGLDIIGIDISKEAILCASKASKDLKINYVVSSAFDIPFIDNYFDCFLSIFSPLDSKEAQRITNAYLIKVIPNKDHLIELKEKLYDKAYKTNILNDNINGFLLVNEEYIRYKSIVNDPNELFRMTPYFYTTHNNFNIDLKEMEISFDFIIRIYKKSNYLLNE